MPCQVTLVDTAGLRESADAIEVAGMQRARSAMRDADIIALVIDRSAASVPLEAATGKAGTSTAFERHGTSHTLQSGLDDASFSDGASMESGMQSLDRLLAEVSGRGGTRSLLDAEGDPLPDTASGASSSRHVSQERGDALWGSRQQPAKLLLVHNKSDIWTPTDNMSGPQGKSREALSSDSRHLNYLQHSTAEQALIDGQLTEAAEGGTPPICAVSCKTGEGMEELLGTLGRLVRQVAGAETADEDSTLITRSDKLLSLNLSLVTSISSTYLASGSLVAP
jgi:tRNA U34 5-carboxymethylaminomethyl modifying GTPase MnmE/TrmE